MNAVLIDEFGGVDVLKVEEAERPQPKNNDVLIKVVATSINRSDQVIDATTPDFTDAIKEFTGKKGVDLILDHVGAAYLKPNMNSLAYKGKLVIIGVISGIKAELNLALMMVKRQQIIGSVLRSRPVPEKAEIVAEFTRRALPKFADRSIVPIIERVYGIDEIVEAHRMMEEDKHFGKIVLKIG
jgi:NADPH:quinone reductase-like Zn-dependent oxidoreductase